MGSEGEKVKAPEGGRVSAPASKRPLPRREPPLANSTRVAMAGKPEEGGAAPRSSAEAVALLRPDLEARERKALEALPDVEQQRAVLQRDLEHKQAVVADLDRQGRTFEVDMEPRIELALLKGELQGVESRRAALQAEASGARQDLDALSQLESTARPGDVVALLGPSLEREQRRTNQALKDAYAQEALVKGFAGMSPSVERDRHWYEALRDEAARVVGEQERLQAQLARVVEQRALLSRAEKEPALLRDLFSPEAEAKRERSLEALPGGGWKQGETRKTEARVGDVPLERKTSSERTVDVAAGTVSRKHGEEISSGARSWSKSQETTLDVTKGELKREVTEERRTKVDEIETSETAKKGWTASAGGVSWEESSSSVDLDRRVKESSRKTEVTRGEGAIGLRRTVAKSEGKRNEEGELEEGSSRTTQVEGKALVGPKGVGASLGSTTKWGGVPAEGVKTGVTVSPSGQFLVSVDEIPDSEPKRYRLVVALKVGATLGASRDVDVALRDASKQKAGALELGGSATLGATYGMVFTHALTAEETAEYFRDLDLAEGGNVEKGNWPELAIIRTAARSNWDMASAAKQVFQARIGNWAATFEGLREGDTVELTRSITAGLEFTGGGKITGGASASVGGGIGRTRELKYVLSRVKGKARVQVERGEELERSRSASAGYLAGSFGLERASKTSASGGFTFALDPGDPAFKDRLEEILAAEDLDALERIADRRSEDVAERSATRGASASGKETLGLGPLSLQFRHGAAQQESTTVEEGKTVKRWEGSNTLGATAGGLGLSYSTDVEEKARASAGPEGARADVSTTSSHTDPGATAERVGELLVKDPLGLLLGGAKVAQTTIHVAGMEFTTEDLAAVAEAAADPDVWATGVVVRAKHVDDWWATRRRILEGGQTVEAVEAALAWFVGREAQGRAETVARLAAKVGAGTRYEWPAGTAQHRKTFSELVVQDPTEGPMKQAAQGKFEEAAEELGQRLVKLRLLGTELEDELARFLDARALAAMIRRTAERKLQVQDALRRLEAALRPADDPGAAARDVADEGTAQRDRLKAALTVARSSKALEQKLLGELAAERGRISPGDLPGFIAKLRAVEALWPRWEAALREVERLPGGPSGAALDALRPDHKAWQVQDDRVGWVNR